MNHGTMLQLRENFSFNAAAQYKAGAQYASGTSLTFRQKLALARPLDIGVSTSSQFTAKVPDILSGYTLPNVTDNRIVDLWNSNARMRFWQNQVNFAVWCAITGCGVSAKDHLDAPEPLMRAFYVFHGYYQIRRILTELRVALPQDPSWNAFENAYDRRAYERLCREFGVDSNTDWRRKGLPNYGLGKAYANGHPIGDGWYYPNFTWGWRGSGTNLTHDPSAPSGWLKESLSEPGSQTVIHADYIAQDDSDAGTAWTTFILDESQGFTQPGVVRINDSIRTYVWAVLGAQAQTRTRILGSGTAFDAQKQFLANLEDAITSPADLPSAIKRYQDTLQYASSKLEYVLGIGLYMAPSDMLLRIGQIEGYNNLIQTATSDMQLGINDHVNSTPVPPSEQPDQEPIDVHHEPELDVRDDGTSRTSASTTPLPTTSVADKIASGQHEDEKIALVVGLVAAGLFFLWRR